MPLFLKKLIIFPKIILLKQMESYRSKDNIKLLFRFFKKN